ncbi:ParA family protein [Sphingomonas profundi]|uniref:ParA family protein n=1 Tax=Alterirhizorhabdus profundi TaxID=2681549 RepID=UPI0012E758C8|nr:ParA family protein [Sphingomonas profundi]
MRVLALASQKGGSGKTILAGHLAVQAERAGAGPVVLIDIDPHGTLATWWNVRAEETPAFAQTTVERLAADIEMLRVQGFRLAIIDTPPLVSTPVASVIALAELVVVPTRPHGDELRAAGGTVDLCARAGKPLLFVVNGAAADTPVSLEATMSLAQHGPVAPLAIHQNPDLADAMLAGLTVIENRPGERAAREMDELWNYVSGRLEKNFRRTVFAVPRVAAGGFGRRGL